MTTEAPSPPEERASASEGVRKNLRGSSLLLSGRFISLAINLGVQVLTIRYLARAEYGMFAYAMSVTAMLTNIVLLGLDKTLSRFVAVYFEQKDYSRMFGSMFAAVAGIALTSTLTIGLIVGLSGELPRLLQAEPRAISLLVVLAFMAPLTACDSVLHALFSVFGSAKAILVRRYVVGPGLKLISVLGVALLGGDAYDIALAYVISLFLGVAIYGGFFGRLLKAKGHWDNWRHKRLVVPWKVLSGYALSLAGAEFVFMFYNSFATMVLEYFHSASEVAGFQAARPFARLNDVVLVAFTHLFVPMLARFFARDDQDGVKKLYVQTAVFISVLSFPLFAVSFGMADTLATVLLGSEYQDAGAFLAWMSFGFFVQALLGTNVHTLRVLGFIKEAVLVDVATVIVAFGGSLLLIPTYGAMGAAVTVSIVVAIKGVIGLFVLRAKTGLQPLQGGQAWTYGTIAAATGAIVMARPVLSHSWSGSALVVLAGIFAVGVVARQRIDIADLFPELGRIPVLNRLLGLQKS